MNLDLERCKQIEEVQQDFNDYRESETKYHQNNIQSEILQAFFLRIAKESTLQNEPESRLTPDHKTYCDYFNAKLAQQNTVIEDLKAHQKHIKENYDRYAGQVDLFTQMRYLLEMKKKTHLEPK